MRPTDASTVRIYRRLLLLYPAAFRARYADEMVQVFGDQWRDAQSGDAGTARMWLRTLLDLVATATAEHLAGSGDPTRTPVPPSASSRLLGIVGILGGLTLLAAFIPDLSWTREVFQLRLVLFDVGAIAIAIAIAVHRRQASRARRASLAAAGAVVLANTWYIAMVVLSVDRPQPPVGDPDFRLVWFYAGAAMWLADAAFGFVAWRLRVVTRWGALVLAVGSVLALLGMDRLELVRGDLAWLFTPVALLGVALNGLGWILLGIDVAFRWRARSAPRWAETDAA